MILLLLLAGLAIIGALVFALFIVIVDNGASRASAAKKKRPRHPALRAFVDDASWFVDGDTVRSADTAAPALLRLLEGPKRSVAGWHIEIEGVALGARTSLAVSARGVLDVLGLGDDDVTIGVPHFDRAWVLRGGAPDVVRGAISAVWQRLEAFLVSRQVSRLSVDAAGRLVITSSLNDARDEALRALLDDARAVAALLGEASSAPALPAPQSSSSTLSSSASSSGSPVAIGARR